MKLGNSARFRLAALCVGGLLGTASAAAAASTAAIPPLPDPDCDPRPRRIVTIVQGVDDFLAGQGQDCTDVNVGPPVPESSSDRSGTDGGNALVTDEEAPAEEAEDADAPEGDESEDETSGGDESEDETSASESTED